MTDQRRFINGGITEGQRRVEVRSARDGIEISVNRNWDQSASITLDLDMLIWLRTIIDRGLIDD
jgi:hypothetical protein